MLQKNAHLWERDPHDWYVEAEWCSQRLFDEEKFSGNVTDPACGTGRIIQAAIDHGYGSGARDIVCRTRLSMTIFDFLAEDQGVLVVENIVCNPPFKHADQFVKLSLQRAVGKVAMLLPATWHCGSARARWLETTPLRRVLTLTPRPSMPPGAVLEAGQKPGGGTKDFAWYIWERGHKGPWEGGWLHRTKPLDGAREQG